MAWSWYNTIVAFMSIGSILAGGLLFALYWFQDNLLYFPQMPEGSRITFEDPRDYDMSPFEEVFFPSKGDQLKIQGWLFLRSTKFPTVMYFCGNAGNIGHRLPHIQGIWARTEVNFFLVSYRGYGKSEGIPSEPGIKRDAEAALDYLHSRGLGERGVIPFGESLGGAVSIYLASHHPEKVRGLILLNTFSSIDDMIAVVFPLLNSVKSLSRNKWASADLIGAVQCPILFLSGARDELVPPTMMKRLHDLAVKSAKKTFELFKNGRHNETWTCSGYFDAVARWLKDEKLNGEAASKL